MSNSNEVEIKPLEAALLFYKFHFFKPDRWDKRNYIMKILILHDYDAKLEIIEVDSSLIKEQYEGDIEYFLCEKDYSVNNITWMCTGEDEVEVTFHNFKVDENGEEIHISREDTIEDLSVEKSYKKIKKREESKLRAAVAKYGKVNDDGDKEYVFDEDNAPVIAGYLCDEPYDITVKSVLLEEEKYLKLVGRDKNGYLDEDEISPDDIFEGHLDYVTSEIIATESNTMGS